MKNEMMNRMVNQLLNPTQVPIMVSCTLSGFDESLSGAPEIWYDINHDMAIKVKVAPHDIFAAVASALQTEIQNKFDENAAMESNPAIHDISFKHC
jgi:hypothetical protein